jgi:hypothetical protein
VKPQMTFDLFIGIDYSGAETPTSRLKGLQVYTARLGELPTRYSRAVSNNGRPCNWSRKEIAEWLIELAQQGARFIAGIDHAFSFPQSYFDRHGLTTWLQFLDDFVRHWPTHHDHTYVDFIRDGVSNPWPEWPGPGLRNGKSSEFRLCEQWTSSAKSVFQFDMQGSVAKSTHAGIPWLKIIRDAVGDRVHIWPFDGWRVESKSVLAEVYPSIFRNRYPREGRSPDEQDAYAVCRWLSECAARGTLPRYFDPPLTLSEREMAAREGWILGIT